MADDNNPVRARILAVAMIAFRQRSYAEVDLDELLQRAEASHGDLEAQFPGGRMELAAAVVREVANWVVRMIDATGHLPTEEGVRIVGQQIMRWQQKSGSAETAFLATMASQMSGNSRLRSEVADAYLRVCYHLQTRLMAEGWSEREAEQRAWFIVSALEGAGIVTSVCARPAHFEYAVAQAAAAARRPPRAERRV